MRFVEKLKCSGFNPRIVPFLQSWLGVRTSVVVVGGSASVPVPLENTVFQGIAFGRPLWNVYYVDASFSVQLLGFTDVVFADDFNCYKSFPAGTSVGDILKECTHSQEELHKCGRANSVRFGSSKESFLVFHLVNGPGEACVWRSLRRGAQHGPGVCNSFT